MFALCMIFFPLYDGEVEVLSHQYILSVLALFMLILFVIMFSFSGQVGCAKLFSVNNLFNSFFPLYYQSNCLGYS